MSRLRGPYGVAASLAVLALATAPLSAGVIQDSPVLPSTEGFYDLNFTVCLLAACITGSEVGNFVVTSSHVDSGNQYVTATATLEAIVFQNNGGNPGMQIGVLNMTGDVALTYVGRDTAEELGTFETILTAMNFSGEFNGHKLTARLNGSKSSTGSTSIVIYTAPSGAALYEVASSLTVYPELSLDGGPFVPGPGRDAILKSPVPEPSSSALLLMGLAAMGAAARRARAA